MISFAFKFYASPFIGVTYFHGCGFLIPILLYLYWPSVVNIELSPFGLVLVVRVTSSIS